MGRKAPIARRISPTLSEPSVATTTECRVFRRRPPEASLQHVVRAIAVGVLIRTRPTGRSADPEDALAAIDGNTKTLAVMRPIRMRRICGEPFPGSLRVGPLRRFVNRANDSTRRRAMPSPRRPRR